MLVKEDLLPPILLLIESPNADHKNLRQLCEQTLDVVQQVLSEENKDIQKSIENTNKFEFQSVLNLNVDLSYINALKSVLNMSYSFSDGNKKLLSTLSTLTSMTDESPKSCELFTLNNGIDLCLQVLKVSFFSLVKSLIIE